MSYSQDPASHSGQQGFLPSILILEGLDITFPGVVVPSLQQHPACMGCQHYHGQIYGNNSLVCAMHPYGWDDSNCPDWEAE